MPPQPTRTPSSDLGRIPASGTVSSAGNSSSFYNAFSGVDIKAIIHIPPDFVQENLIIGDKKQYLSSTTKSEEDPAQLYSKPLVLADIQTLSYSIYREKYPVRTIGMAYPKGFTRGPRTIAGSLIFTMFDRQVLLDVINRIRPDTANDLSTPLIDQLPRFDITITFANEYGAASTMVIYGVELVSEGVTMSIEDLFTENTVSYIAQDMTPMRPDYYTMKRLGADLQPKTASDLIEQERRDKRTVLV